MLHRLSVCMDFLQSKLQQGKTPHHFEQLLRSFSHYFLPFHSSPTEIMPNQYNSFSWSVMVKRVMEYFLFLVLINRTPFHVLRGTMVMLCWLCFYLDRLLRCISYFIIVWHVRFLELCGHCWKQELAFKHEWMQIPFELETSDVLDCNIQQLRKYARSDWSKTYMIYYIGKRKEKGIRTLNPDHEP